MLTFEQKCRWLKQFDQIIQYNTGKSSQ